MNLQNEHKIIAWMDDVNSAGCTVKSIKSLHEIHKRNGELLFALLNTEVISPEGIKLPHILFIRGHACIIVPLLRNIDTGEERFLMVCQRRIGNGQLSIEFPAGMLDTEKDTFVVALKELEEETGLTISRDEIYPLYDGKLYSSAGASDEAIYYFGCVKELDNATYESFRKKTGGNPDENEHITVHLMTREEAELQATSLQVKLGFFLFEEFRHKQAGNE